MHNGGEDSTKVIDENLWNPRRLGASSVNKTAPAVVQPYFMGIAYEGYGISPVMKIPPNEF